MVAFNKNDEEISYLRFTMGDSSAFLLYDLLDANEYNGGVSGLGKSTAISLEQIEKAVQSYNLIRDQQLYDERNEFRNWQHNEIVIFLENCLKTAKTEKNVRVLFC